MQIIKNSRKGTKRQKICFTLAEEVWLPPPPPPFARRACMSMSLEAAGWWRGRGRTTRGKRRRRTAGWGRRSSSGNKNHNLVWEKKGGNGIECSCRLLLRRGRSPGAPLELDRLPHHLWVVQLEVADLLGDVLAHGLGLEVGDEVGDEAAVRLRLEVAHLLGLLHGRLKVLVVAHLLACAFCFKY